MEAGRCSNPSGSGAGTRGSFWRTFGPGAAAPFPEPPAGSGVPRGVASVPARSGQQRLGGPGAGSGELKSAASSGRDPGEDGLGGPPHPS